RLAARRLHVRAEAWRLSGGAARPPRSALRLSPRILRTGDQRVLQGGVSLARRHVVRPQRFAHRGSRTRSPRRQSGRSAPMSDAAIELVVVIPTYCERDNLPELVRRLRQTLVGIEWEAIVVDDDSPDQTAQLARSLSLADRRVRCLHRIGRRGLSSACIEGML